MINRKMGERRLGAATLPTSRYDLFSHQIQTLKYEDGGNAAGDANAGDAGQQQSGDKSGTAGGQQAANPAAGDNQDAGSQVEAFKAKAVDETTKRQAAEEKVANLTQQINVLSANQSQTEQPQQPQGLYAQVIAKLGLQDEPYLNAEQTGQVLNAMMQVTQATAAQGQFLSSHPDFAEVVGKQVGNQFVYAAPLQRTLASNPALAQALLNSPNSGILAYALASKDPEYVAALAEKGKSPELTQAEETAALLAQAQNTQQSISTVAGQGNMDKAAAIRAMTDDEFRVYKENLMAKAV